MQRYHCMRGRRAPHAPDSRMEIGAQSLQRSGVRTAELSAMEHFITTLALTGIVIVVASLLSGAVECSGIPLVAGFLALGAALGPFGLALADIDLASPALPVIAAAARWTCG
ncbi:MAG TPA: hypothetical protein VJO52_05265 [Gemmatimonadaceae bacterium]|nr:hypothetical protein [Gemmatimonadaceae bacterium]